MVVFCFKGYIAARLPGYLYKMDKAVHIAAEGKGAIITDAYLVLARNTPGFYPDAATGGSVNGIAEQVANNIRQRFFFCRNKNRPVNIVYNETVFGSSPG